jgi:hypothetical protein
VDDSKGAALQAALHVTDLVRKSTWQTRIRRKDVENHRLSISVEMVKGQPYPSASLKRDRGSLSLRLFHVPEALLGLFLFCPLESGVIGAKRHEYHGGVQTGRHTELESIDHHKTASRTVLPYLSTPINDPDTSAMHAYRTQED